MGRSVKIVFGVAAVIFLVAPLFAILPLAFTSSVFLTYPVPSWSMRWFEELATADAWRRAIVNSLIIGFGTMTLATVLGTMAALRFPMHCVRLRSGERRNRGSALADQEKLVSIAVVPLST